jgi:hypothetical protein
MDVLLSSEGDIVCNNCLEIEESFEAVEDGEDGEDEW